eukprot:NODE_75_length_23373_cov_0.434261.p9 type:complete len:272 gc:universal NODE_75_length_23373_cov_0.434261:5165-5980(+)
MSFQQFYAISSQQDCLNTCQQSDCQGYKWDASGNCYLYFLVGNSSISIIGSREGKIPEVPDFTSSTTQCIASACNAVKTTDLYDFNKCVQDCKDDSDCTGFAAGDNQQYCTLFKSSGTPQTFTGYTFNKKKADSVPITSNTLPIIIGVIAAVVVFISIIVFIMIKRLKKPIGKQVYQPESERDFYDRPLSFQDPRNSVISSEEPFLPRPLSHVASNTSNNSKFQIRNATYNDLWSTSNSMDRNNKVPIPGIDTSMHIDYHLSREDNPSTDE